MCQAKANTGNEARGYRQTRRLKMASVQNPLQRPYGDRNERQDVTTAYSIFRRIACGSLCNAKPRPPAHFFSAKNASLAANIRGCESLFLNDLEGPISEDVTAFPAHKITDSSVLVRAPDGCQSRPRTVASKSRIIPNPPSHPHRRPSTPGILHHMPNHLKPIPPQQLPIFRPLQTPVIQRPPFKLPNRLT